MQILLCRVPYLEILQELTVIRSEFKCLPLPLFCLIPTYPLVSVQVLLFTGSLLSPPKLRDLSLQCESMAPVPPHIVTIFVILYGNDPFSCQHHLLDGILTEDRANSFVRVYPRACPVIEHSNIWWIFD